MPSLDDGEVPFCGFLGIFVFFYNGRRSRFPLTVMMNGAVGHAWKSVSKTPRTPYPLIVRRSGVTPGCCFAANGAAAGYCASPKKDVVTGDFDDLNVQ